MRYLIITLMVCLMSLVGCSNRNNPVDSSSSDLSDISFAGENFSGTGLFGSYDLSVDPESMSADLVPKRDMALGESFLVSGLAFFTVSPCADCLNISGLRLTGDGYLEILFKISHPFEPGDPLKPPSGKNRLDLYIFDVALVVVPKSETPDYYPLLNESVFLKPCVLADGFSKEIGELTGESIPYPYYLVVDNYDDGIDMFNEFPMGGEKDFSIFLDLESPLQFDMYLTFGYGASATFSTRLNPMYFNPEFNRKNAWKVEVIPPNGDDPPTIGNTWQADDDTTEYTVTVKVWDWQHGNTSISNPPVNTEDIAKSSDVSLVEIEIPGMTDTLPQAISPVSGTGNDPADPLIFEIPVANENPLAAGEYTGLVKVTDERIPTLNPLEYEIDQLIHQADSETMEWYEIPEFATYQLFTASVVTVPDCETQEELLTGHHSSILDEYKSIIRTQSEWETFYAMYDPFGTPPDVDFDNLMVVAVFIGGRSNSGYSVGIDCVRFYPTYVDVEFTENIPGPG